MIIIPAIDIRGGACVRLFQGDYARETVYARDPLTIVQQWVKHGADRLHIIDLDGARDKKPTNKDIIAKMIQTTTIPIQVGGGIRTIEDIEWYIKNGVSYIILGTSALEDQTVLKDMIHSFAKHIIVSLDIRNMKIVKNGWLEESPQSIEETIMNLESLGVERFIITDVTKDGTLSGPNIDLYKDLRRTIRGSLIVAGGVSTTLDIERLQSIGVDGVIIGKALYEGTIKLSEIL